MKTNGVHVIVDCWNCGSGADDLDGACQAMRRAVDAMGATLLNLSSHRFTPHGFTAVAILSESHLAVHSWPENGYVAVDVLTCGDAVEPQPAVEALAAFFEPEETEIRRIERGARRPITVETDGS